MTHDCAHHGHLWMEPSGVLYSRHRNRRVESVAVACQHCTATATLPAKARYSGTRPKGMPVDPTIPAPLHAVIRRALDASDNPDTHHGPVPKSP